MRIETRPLSWFLKQRATQTQTEEKLEQKEKRLKKRKKDEDERRKRLQENKKKQDTKKYQEDFLRIDSFVNHAHKSLSSVLKIYDQLPKNIRESKDLDLLFNLLQKVDVLKRDFSNQMKKLDS